MKEPFKLADLARISGTPPRTIRFYIARGLLQGPAQAGRNAIYGDEHVKRLAEVAKFKAQGLTLEEIGYALEPRRASDQDLPSPTPVANYAISPDVTVLVRADLPPWRMRQVRRILAELRAQLGKEPANESEES
ncbi:MAG: MerR family transcriptional regulator [Lentisphaerae bacterium]|nr:MerR family transcriptional regulator [Lentisphaerota bacterium]